MRAFVSGQIGVDKGPYLNAVQDTARKNGIDLVVCHLGNMMYAEAPDVPAGRILNLPTTQTTYPLMFERHRKKVYLSFPMSHVMDLPKTLEEINTFKATINQHFTTFDPADVDEFVLHTTAVKAMEEGKTTIEVRAAEGTITLKTADVAQISGDIMGQIYDLDFKMVDQSDMIISLVPELPNGKPGLSSGVERELHHAFEGGKEVFVIWACRGTPSPFITETATGVFKSTTEAIEYFRGKGYIK